MACCPSCGTQLKIDVTALDGTTWTPIANLTDVSTPTIDVEESDCSTLHMTDGNDNVVCTRDICPSGFVDLGTVDFEGFFCPCEATIATLMNIMLSTSISCKYFFCLEFGTDKCLPADTDLPRWIFTGFPKTLSGGAVVGDNMTLSGSIRVNQMISWPGKV